MSKKGKNRSVGSVPGTVHFTGVKRLDESIISYLAYNESQLVERNYERGNTAKIIEPDAGLIIWYDIRGLHDTELIEKIGAAYEVHPLVLEDAVDVTQRPKYEEYEEGVFLTFKGLELDDENWEINTEHISIFFGSHYLISFQEKKENSLIDIMQRIRQGRGRVRTKKADYLAYVIIDSIVDQYFGIIDTIEEAINDLEISLLTDAEQINKRDIHRFKILLIELRKHVNPLREAIAQFTSSDSQYIDQRTPKYLRDTYDHLLNIVESIDSYKDTLSGLQDLYLSEISLRMNKIIQFLTIITSIFVPITFLTGLYGMNFKYIPELEHPNGYFVLLGVITVITLGLIYYFRRIKWL